MKKCVRLIRCEWQGRKGTAGIYNRRPDEFDTKGAMSGRQRTKLDAIRRRLLLAEKELNEAMRILSEEIVTKGGYKRLMSNC